MVNGVGQYDLPDVLLQRPFPYTYFIPKFKDKTASSQLVTVGASENFVPQSVAQGHGHSNTIFGIIIDL